MFKKFLLHNRKIAVVTSALIGIGITIPVYANLSNSMSSIRDKTYSLQNKSRLSPSKYQNQLSKTQKKNQKKARPNSIKPRTGRSLLSSPIRVSDAFGVNFTFPETRQPGELKMIVESGVRWVRMDMVWAYVEKNKGQYNFDIYDKTFDEFAKHNIRPLVVLGSHGQTNYPNKSGTYPYPPDTDEARQAYTNWAVAAVQRYQGRGIFWEVYNEPNNSAYWPLNADVQDYRQLAYMVGKAVKQAAPSEILVGGALLFADTNYLEETLKGGVLPFWDAVSLHPYRHWGSPETVTPDYDKFRNVIQKYNSSGAKIPLISGEWGYPKSVWNGVSYDEQKQARFLARQWLVNLSNNVPVSIWFEWKDAANDPMAFGLVRNKYYPGRSSAYDAKPSYFAAKALTTSLKDYAFSQRLKVGSSADYALEFNNVVRGGPSKAYAVWRDASTSMTLNLPITSGKYNVISFLGKNLGTINAGPQGTAIKVNSSPKYLVPVP
jgi:polysaccharide biosynthesis protein PslG